MKCILFIAAALMGTAAAKKGHKDKCTEEFARRCHANRNQVQQCISGQWVTLEWCKSKFGDHGTCSEEPTVECRRPDSPVATTWDPQSLPEKPSLLVVTLTPGVVPTGIPGLQVPQPDIQSPDWVAEPSW